MQLYNTLARSKQEFVPIVPGKVGIYCCGPTVYNFAHIGNLRTYIFEDILRRTLRFSGLEVRHVMNITDVGHLESDADEGEDKMEKGARREGLSVWDLARKYEAAWLADMTALNIERPEVICRATEHVAEMIALTERLVERGFAYAAPGAVYFDTSRFGSYAELARLDLSGMQAGAGGRVGVVGEKRHPNDFVLWFLDRPKHLMQWDSPWGRGYPGWHVECSAMSMKYLGETFDIHCGGIDHIPVHHTNEIAQSEAATGKPFVRYWLHGEFLIIGKQDADDDDAYTKMSKSSDNFITVSVVKERGFDPLSYRFLCLMAHYRSELKFTWENLESAQQGLRRVYAQRSGPDPLENDSAYEDARGEVARALYDDLNTPNAVGLLSRYGSDRLWQEFDAVLGLGIAQRRLEREEPLPEEITQLIAARNEARKAKEWAKSDALRDEIISKGYEVGDGPQGTTVKPRIL